MATIVILLKAVPDNTKLKKEQLAAAQASTQFPATGVDWMMNPFDEYALETALRLKDQRGGDTTVAVLSVAHAGNLAATKDLLKKAIAAGADEASVIVSPEGPSLKPAATAQLLAAGVKTLFPAADIVCAGQQSLDLQQGLTGPMVAQLWQAACVGHVKNVQWQADTVHADCETERGKETFAVSLPAVLCTMKCNYELRGSNIKGVMKANKTPIAEKTPADLGVTLASDHAVTVTALIPPAEKTAGRLLQDLSAAQMVTETVQFLKDKQLI